MWLLKLHLPFFLLLSLGTSTGHGSSNEQIPLSDYACTHPPYQIHIFSTSPLVIYIANFITPEERAHLIDITKDTFSYSAVSDESGAQGLRQTRTSKSTTVPPDPIVDCISSRALSFQGLSTPPSHLEPLQLVSYNQNQTYHFHTDWFTSPSQATFFHGGNRVTSFFAYIHASDDLVDGGTNFPILDAPRPWVEESEEGDVEDKWCEYIDCDVPYDDGVTFRAIEGNAVFWVNMIENGMGGLKGDERVLHAGLPVLRGKKVGMNIWTREGPISPEIRGYG